MADGHSNGGVSEGRDGSPVSGARNPPRTFLMDLRLLESLGCAGSSGLTTLATLRLRSASLGLSTNHARRQMAVPLKLTPNPLTPEGGSDRVASRVKTRTLMTSHRGTASLVLATWMTIVCLGCGTVREHRQLSQPLGKPLTASVGSTLFRLSKRGDLPNAFGGRDIYGGKVDKGFAEVKLKAVREERFLDLVVFDVSKDSSETTMDRYKPFDNAIARVDVSQTVNIGSPAGANGMAVTVDAGREKEYVLNGIRMLFLEIRSSSVVYTLEDLQASK